MIETSVVIPTYRRPDGVRRAVASVVAQQGASGFEIVVIDNDVDGSAASVVAALGASATVPIRYVHEKRPGISYARNTGVARATGRYLAFLDDDEEAGPGWLANLLTTLAQFGADAAVGPVLPRFPAEAGAIDPYRRRVYTRDARVPSGTSLLRWNIGNSLFVKARCFVGDQPFAPELGRTGGEDTVFLRQMTRRGCRMVWCAEAVVWETVPAERLAADYLLRRAFRGAQTTTFVCAAVRPREWRRAARLMATGAAQLAVYGPAALVLRALRRERGLPVTAKAVAGLGKLLWHPRLHLRMYR
ncbi:MAG: glycosyltransferase family 2 protein [Alphaproteobacteria bacterium]|nr:glycosyltransferase family 2 protein [Alphaproteobacteria bacterium]